MENILNTFVNNFVNFYTTERMSVNMSDEGGPFGFDIHHALEVDFIIKKYNVDCIVETGTNAGDTAEYLCRSYPDKYIVTTEIDPTLYSIAKKRLVNYKNVELLHSSSESVITYVTSKFNYPFFYLDAHWNDYWPLFDELKNIKKGVVCVGDFLNPYQQFVEDQVYCFDTYNEVRCDQNLIRSAVSTNSKIYTNNILDFTVYELPCLQRARRAGRAYIEVGTCHDWFETSNYFLEVHSGME